MPDGSQHLRPAFRLISAHDLFAERMAEIDRQAKRSINRSSWVPDTWEGLADSIAEANRHRLRNEDR